jgi:hypothetical protein
MHTTPMAFFEWLRRLFRPTGVLHCSFCGASQQQVAKLIAGPRDIYLCDGCARLCIGIVDAETHADDHVGTARWEVLRVLQAMPWPAPRAATRRLARAAIALSEGDAVRLREVATAAMNAHDHHAGLEALGAIPSGARGASDRFHEAVCYACEDTPAEAARSLDACDLDALAPHEREAARVLRPLFGLRAKDPLDTNALDGLVAETTAALAAQGASEAYTASHRRACLEAQGLAALRRGELAAAERVLREAIAGEKPGPYVHLALREVQLARGDFAGAVVARLHALEALHPESPIAVRLQAEGKDGPFRSA